MDHDDGTQAHRWRIGIDVGGTFTDFIAVPDADGRHDLSRAIVHKVPSTPADPAQGVEQGLAHLLADGIDVAAVASVTHGTTIGLNAILQGKGARVALLTSAGHRDLLQIGRSRLPRSFDLHAAPPRPAVPREHVVELACRFEPDGTPVADVDEAAYTAARDALAALAPQAVAVSLVGGYAAPAAEQSLAARLAEDLGVLVTAASVVWPEAGEYERTTLAVLDAQIKPLMTAYFASLQTRLARLGLRAPLFISTSNGGSVALSSAVERPVLTVLSGPAGGVGAAARLWGERDVVTVDMGGTSSDIGVLRGGRPVLTTRSSIGEHPIAMPVVEVSAIGAGGGSVIWADDSGAESVLRVGPGSVGADPGPASYGGGGLAALTDAYVHAGVIDPAGFLGGALPLSADAAAAALRAVADELGERDATTVVDAAFRTATAGMAAQVRTILARHGETPERFTFVAFGGAGGTHAAMLAEALGVHHVIVPAAAGTFCALGAAIAPVRRDFFRTVRQDVTAEGVDRVSDACTELAREAVDWLDSQGVGTTGAVQVTADARYVGQPTTLSVPLSEVTADAVQRGSIALDAADVVDAFTAVHTRHYGFADAGAVVELVAVRVSITGAELPVAHTGTAPRFLPLPSRSAWSGGTWRDLAVVTLAAAHEPGTIGGPLPGPAVVEKPDTTVLVPAGWCVHTDAAGNLHLTRTDTEEDRDADAA